MKIKLFLDERKFQGDAIETGGTARKFGSSPAPALSALFKSGGFEGAKKVIDYGAGVGARNANFLREQGIKVYAYDPYNGTAGADGWEETSTKLPRGKFDVGFTSFVLNVVPESVEQKIIADLKRMCKQSYHITRHMDIFRMVKGALARGDRTVTDFFLTHFADDKERAALEDGTLDDETIMEFCQHGLQTSSGFQRIPMPEMTGELNLIRKIDQVKVYSS